MTAASWTLREAFVDNDRDVAELAALRYDWRVGELGENGPSSEKFAQSLASWWRGNAVSHVALVGSVDDEAVAMAWLAIVERVPSPTSPERRCGYVQSVYVRPQFRNRGIGHDVVAQLLAIAQARGLDYVAVHPTEKSFTFYQRLSFSPTSKVLELDFRVPVPS